MVPKIHKQYFADKCLAKWNLENTKLSTDFWHNNCHRKMTYEALWPSLVPWAMWHGPCHEQNRVGPSNLDGPPAGLQPESCLTTGPWVCKNSKRFIYDSLFGTKIHCCIRSWFAIRSISFSMVRAKKWRNDKIVRNDAVTECKIILQGKEQSTLVSVKPASQWAYFWGWLDQSLDRSQADPQWCFQNFWSVFKRIEHWSICHNGFKSLDKDKKGQALSKISEFSTSF